MALKSGEGTSDDGQAGTSPSSWRPNRDVSFGGVIASCRRKAGIGTVFKTLRMGNKTADSTSPLPVSSRKWITFFVPRGGGGHSRGKGQHFA